MQKIILIALLATCAIAVQVNVASQTGTAAGYVVSMGVIQKCHLTCATCDGPLETNCLTCHPADATLPTGGVAMAVGTATADLGKCGCFTTAAPSISAKGAKFYCEAVPANAAAATASATLCPAAGPAWFNVKLCEMCLPQFKACDSATTTTAAAGSCWAGLAATGTSSATGCPYAENKTYISGDDTATYDQTGATASVINGYFYTATGFVQAACAKGCLTCTNATTGCACASGFTIVGTTQACECVAAGNFATAATATAVDACTPCAAGCVTCSSATVCTVCDSSTHVLGSTTSSSSTCESIADTSATTSTDDTTTTSGTADGETSATATATNGVLITAASMLLAVILA